ncbi:MAG: class II fructose-bisphosphate aldolase [Caldilineaceae bacterium]
MGTAHGIYPKDKKPELKLDLLKKIASMVDIPLVLHGGSANPEEEIVAAVKLGINKINISSDMKDAFYKKRVKCWPIRTCASQIRSTRPVLPP